MAQALVQAERLLAHDFRALDPHGKSEELDQFEVVPVTGLAQTAHGILYLNILTDEEGPTKIRRFRGRAGTRYPRERTWDLVGKLQPTGNWTLQEVYTYTDNFTYKSGFRDEFDDLIQFYSSNRNLLGEIKIERENTPTVVFKGHGKWQ